jgi:hypothetical protein
MSQRHRYAIELFKEDGTPLGRSPVDVDWEPALEWVRFLAIRQGRLSPAAWTQRGEIEPVWQTKAGPPYVSAVCVSVRPENDGEPVAVCVPTTYFRALARERSAAAVEQGLLKDNEYFRYLVQAFPGETEPAATVPDAASYTVEEVVQPPRMRATRLADFLSQSVMLGDMHASDMPVLIPPTVLDEASDLTRHAGARETGGILIGHLHRHTDVAEISVVVTAQIPASYTQSALTRLTFTANTWAAVQTAIDLRRRDEIYLGWWHSHSYLKKTCKDCAQRKAGVCSSSAAFMSTEDCALHRTVFPRAYSVALVISDSPCAGLKWELFGWRHGLITPRAFHMLRGVAVDAEAYETTSTGREVAHATNP